MKLINGLFFWSVFVLGSCSHTEEPLSNQSDLPPAQVGADTAVRVNPKTGAMERTSAVGMQHQQVPCKVNHEKKPGYASQAGHVEIGISKDVPSVDESGPAVYSRYQKCDE